MLTWPRRSTIAFDKDGNKFSDMKVYNIRDAIFEPLINKYYEDPDARRLWRRRA